MPSHYYDDEYKGAEHATDVFRAPKKEKTAGQKLEESGEFMPDAEQEDLSQQVNYSTMEDIYARERRPGFDREMEAIGKAKRAGNLTDQELIEAHKRAKRIRDAEDEIDPETGWPMHIVKGAWWAMQKVGEGFDWVDKQVGIPGTDIDVYHARRKILDPLSETHLALGILGEILLPDSIDIATAGFSYIPNRFRKAGKAGIKLWAKLQKAGKTTDDINIAKKGAEKFANFQGKDVEKIWQEEGLMMAIKPDPDDVPPIIPQKKTVITEPAYWETPGMVKRAYAAGLTQGGKAQRLNYRAAMNNRLYMDEKNDYLRLVAGDFSTTPETGLAISKRAKTRDAAFRNYRKELMVEFEADYGDYMRANNIPLSSVGLDHQMTLVQSLGMYHNTNPNMPIWSKIQNIALKRGYTPGDSRYNLGLAPEEAHRIKTRFMNDLHGKGDKYNNLKYWKGDFIDPDTGINHGSRLDIMDKSHQSPEAEALHLKIVDTYFDEVDRSMTILADAQAVWRAENLKGILPEQVSDELFKVIGDPKYKTKGFKAVIDSIVHSEADNIKNLKKVLDIEEQLDRLDALGEGTDSILDGLISIKKTDTPEIKKLKRQLKKLRTPKLSNWFKNWKKEVDKTKGQGGLDLYDYQKIIDTMTNE